MRKWLIVLVVLAGGFSTLLAQPTVKELLSKKEKCLLPFDQSKIDTVAYIGVWDARNGNSYVIPNNLIDKHIYITDTITDFLLSDTAFYTNSTGDISIKMWDSYTINTSIAKVGKKITPAEILKAQHFVDSMFVQACTGNLPQLGKVTVKQTCKAMNGYSFSYALYAEDDIYGYTYKCLVTQLAVSGDLMANNMLVRFPKTQSANYANEALYLVNAFWGLF